MNTAPTYEKEVVLIGGGHTHALLLNMWAKMPVANVRITLVSPSALTPYSGMLPGLIAGHFSFDEAHIDLARLCQLANARFVQSSATHADPVNQVVKLDGRPPLSYDIASINTGITPDVNVIGSAQYATPIKPIANLYDRWLELFSRLQQQPPEQPNLSIAVVGGGAAAVEFIQALASRLGREPTITQPAKLILLQGTRGLPENYPRSVQRAIKRQLEHLNIHVVEHFFVTEVQRLRDGGCRLVSASGDEEVVNEVFWCTNARGANWIACSDLCVDDNGFILTNSTLEVVDANNLFACGDCAAITDQPRPKAGVFAVRQAQTLYRNLLAKLQGKPLIKHHSQKHFLSIITGGDRWAVASKGALAIGAPAPAQVWRWKRLIDQRFMAQFLPSATRIKTSSMLLPLSKSDIGLNADMRCGGCGAKISSILLRKVLSDIKVVSDESIVMGVDSSDDCAVIAPPDGKLLCQSVDVLKSLVTDPYVQGKIAAEHALSDLFAMGARPHSAQAIVNLPFAADRLLENDLRQLMTGATEVLNGHGCTLTGGHTSEANELSIGFSVNGFADAEKLLRKSSVRAGDYLILTKSLGIGMLFAAHNQAAAKGVWIEAAVNSMLHSNASAAKICAKFNVSAVTDITGFGLLGHLLEMLDGSSFNALIELDKLPILDGATEVSAQGFLSSLDAENRKQAGCLAPDHQKHQRASMIFDPQTAGGLLIAVAPEDVSSLRSTLIEQGYESASIVGQIEHSTQGSKYRVRLISSCDSARD